MKLIPGINNLLIKWFSQITYKDRIHTIQPFILSVRVCEYQYVGLTTRQCHQYNKLMILQLHMH